VAEHALALLLALAKRLPQMDASVRAGTWSAGTPRPVELHGRRLTVLGFGRSGRRLAVAAAALGMKVTVHARSLASGTTSEGFRATPSLAEALDGAEALSVHLPLGPSTRGLIGAAELARLAPGALVVNVARGGIVDESALARAEHLGGVASDVFAEEPPPPGHPLLALEGAILTPHVAGVTEAALRRMGLEAAGSVVDFLAGRLDPARRLA
jgi:D-3-phosphoglycerate dehydrogenase / 2-oxoglutarate reductase